ncbi:MAG: hypothetical protein IT380_10425 [Myxococcales bacterium]|nr:hypothetical protein [Myxococcales bacterium]
MRVVVLGGTGFLGAKVVRALQAAGGLEVVAASRRGPVPLDVTRPETWGALECGGRPDRRHLHGAGRRHRLVPREGPHRDRADQRRARLDSIMARANALAGEPLLTFSNGAG